jgi:hypothetical protein
VKLEDIARWVRNAIPGARRRSTVTDRAAKLQAIRRAAKHNFPTADIEQMLAEIKLGDSVES